MSGRRKEKRRHVLPAVVENIGNGYFVFFPTLTRASGSGITYEAALESARLSAQSALAELHAADKTVRPSETISLTFLEVEG